MEYFMLIFHGGKAAKELPPESEHIPIMMFIVRTLSG
jgi:hypothetical protein